MAAPTAASGVVAASLATAAAAGSRGVAVVVGAGPGLGLAAAKKFAKEGFLLALIGRNKERLQELTQQVESSSTADVSSTPGTQKALAVPCDCTDESAVKAAFEAIRSNLGRVDVLVYNANIPFPWPPPKFTDISLERFESSLRAQAVGAFLCSQQVLPDMESMKRGTILFTGATGSLRGGKGFVELAAGKFALRALAQCLAREYHPLGIHVAHVIIDGGINTPWAKSKMGRDPSTLLDPDAIAETYWQLHTQNPTTWTHELDLRPNVEKF